MNQNWDRVLELIFNYPNKSYTVREIARKAKVPSSSVQRYLERLRKQRLITKDNQAIMATYPKFRKSFFLIDKMFNVGLIDYVVNEMNPSIIIIFGSVRKGEYDYESDIDIFVESLIKKKVDLSKFERRLKRKVQIFVESDINKLQPNLFNNVVNGIKLYGSFKLK